MPVRLKITLLFTALVSLILMLVCSCIYYFSYTTRLNNIKARLKNRAITTARLLGQSSFFDHQLVRKIDTSTALAIKEKSIQVYDYLDNKIYWYADKPKDTIPIKTSILDDTRVENDLYFRFGRKDVIAHHYAEVGSRLVVVAAAYDEAGKKNLQQLSLILWLSFAGGIIISLAGGYLFSGTLLSPIRNITNEVKEISAQDMARRIKTSENNDEWHHLSSTLNELLNRLQQSFETQRRFIANASHELSTPLTVISSQLEVALQRDREPQDYKKILHSVFQDTRQLNQLTKTLLEFAKASGNPGGLEIQSVRIDEVLFELPGHIKKMNPEYSIALDFDDLPPEQDKLVIIGNHDLLLTAINNIVSNACKFSPVLKAEVTLKCFKNQVNVEVHNEGKSIPATELENIFQPFYRAHETRSVPGFGLGLPLAKRIISLHKGTITVTSEPGKGTSFYITLPVS
ncbi:MAG: HAMP domain-containing histidine kinase [Chitinophagaceae bacterium]|nr:HAMP domain-containing histidine kinase [Chitinophagaceae bacterium]